MLPLALLLALPLGLSNAGKNTLFEGLAAALTLSVNTAFGSSLGP